MSWRKQYRAAIALGKARKKITVLEAKLKDYRMSSSMQSRIRQRELTIDDMQLRQRAAQQHAPAGYQWSGVTPFTGFFGSMFG